MRKRSLLNYYRYFIHMRLRFNSVVSKWPRPTGFADEPRWVQGPDLNRGPSGYEPDELPDCSTLQHKKEDESFSDSPCDQGFFFTKQAFVPYSTKISYLSLKIHLAFLYQATSLAYFFRFPGKTY